MTHHARSLMAVALLSCCLSTPALAAPADRDALPKSVVGTYADIASASYDDALAGATALAESIDAFVAAPSAEALTGARAAWIAARLPYTQTEAFRFCDGPIERVEGLINSWPIDENLIDYVEEEPAAGIVNQPERFGDITAGLISSLNEKDGEKNITTGFHAIEFLLWGQDLDDTGPGARSYRDYVDAPHADRRRQYLQLAARLLVQHLAGVTDAWAAHDEGNYRGRFIAMPTADALACIIKGIGVLSGGELAGERLTVPYETKEQEDEHSCFSDNTQQDLLYDVIGIENVVLGRYVRRNGAHISGPGLRDLVARAEPALGDRLATQAAAAVAAARAVPAPFDRAIQGTDAAPGRVAVKALIGALRAEADSLAKAGAALGLNLNF